MVAALADVQAHKEVRRLAGRGQDGAHAAFEGVDAGGDGVAGGIGQPGIEITAVFQVEEAAHLVGGFVFEGRALHDGKLPGFAASGLIARMDAKGVNLAHFYPFISTKIASRESDSKIRKKFGKYFYICQIIWDN